MKKIGIIVFIFALVVGVSVASFVSWGKATGNIVNFKVDFGAERGSGNMATETRSVSDFSQIEVSSVFHVEITAQQEYRLEIEADDNLLQHITTEVRNGRLEISLDKRVKTKNPMKVRISAPNIDRIDASGASFVDLSNLKNNELTVDTSGASKISVAGETGKLVVDVSGASRIDAGSLSAQTANIDASGASHVSVNVVNELIADASGASRVTYSGSPSVTRNTSGAGSVSQK